MATKRRTGNWLAGGTEQRPEVDQFPARLFPIQHQIQELENELNAFNERIGELDDEGHRGHATDVLKVNAMDFVRQIDELRSVLVVVPTKKGRS